MSPRPRTIDDAAILAATSRVIGRVGPAKLTLAKIAQEVGLSPATLVQRFGSKRGLLLALGRQGQGEGEDEALTRLRGKHESPLAALREYLLCFARMAKTPDELANHLAAFQMDIADPELRAVTRALGKQHETSVATLLEEALAARELRDCSPEALAPALLAVVQGALLGWAIFRRGSARAWVARHLDTILEPYLPRR